MREIERFISIFFLLFIYIQPSYCNAELVPVNDTILLSNYCQLAVNYSETNRDSAVIYSNLALEMADKLNQKFYKACIHCDLGYNLFISGDYGGALSNLLIANKLAQDPDIAKNAILTSYLKKYFDTEDPKMNRIILIAYIKNNLALVYGGTQNFQKQLSELKEVKRIVESEADDLNLKYSVNNNIANAFLNMEELDSALHYQLITLEIEKNYKDNNYKGTSNVVIGEIYFRKKNYRSAINNYLIGIKLLLPGENYTQIGSSQHALAEVYRIIGKVDSSLMYARASITSYKALGNIGVEMADVYQTLSLTFGNINKFDSAYFYLQQAKNISDTLSDKEIKTLTNFHNLSFKEQMRLMEGEATRVKVKNRNQFLLLLAGIILFGIITLVLFRSN